MSTEDLLTTPDDKTFENTVYPQLQSAGMADTKIKS